MKEIKEILNGQSYELYSLMVSAMLQNGMTLSDVERIDLLLNKAYNAGQLDAVEIELTTDGNILNQ